jgi:hypothetical protein
MKIHSDISVGKKKYRKGDELPARAIYPFFLLHMGMFGGSGFLMAYSSSGPDITFLYLHGGFAILIYLLFYLTIFGRDAVKWMFINAGLGLFGIYAQIDWILSWFGKQAGDYSVARHAIPFLYYVLYTFLLYQMVLDLTRARDNPEKRRRVEFAYVVISLLVYGGIYLRP